MGNIKTVLVTGGAGYVGSVLVPKLIDRGYRVKVLDWYIYGDVFRGLKHKDQLQEIKGDIRDVQLVEKELRGIDAVIHFACISNDPSFELDPLLGKSINYDATVQLVDLAKKAGVGRFIYASSSSVYGVKKEKEVTEDFPLEPLTDYSKYKAMCEEYILSACHPVSVHEFPKKMSSRVPIKSGRGDPIEILKCHGIASPSLRARDRNDMAALILRPATICGFSPRFRLDLTVNMLTLQALVKKRMTVFGGAQMRPNIHIEDMADIYIKSLEFSQSKICGKVFNVGFQNYSLAEIAKMIKKTLKDDSIKIEISPTKDLRSYKISSEKIKKELGFVPRHTVEEAITDLKQAYLSGNIINPLVNIKYYNLKMMKKLEMK